MITFNQEVFPVPNATYIIDKFVLRIKVLPGEDSDPSNLNITSWNVTNMD